MPGERRQGFLGFGADTPVLDLIMSRIAWLRGFFLLSHLQRGQS